MISNPSSSQLSVKGPYIHWINEHELQLSYLHPEGLKTFREPVNGEEVVEVKGRLDDQGEVYKIRRHPQPPAEKQEGLEKILVMGDMHGMYDKLKAFLLNNKVINEQGSWQWGTGQLVFCGDLLDRGEQVTEMLWFIYRLEQEAEAAGGAVHLLLGNHEFMIMEGDYRYLHPQYRALLENSELAYCSFFDRESVFGQWIRSRHTVIRLNDLLISHAGISPAVATSDLSLEQINEKMQLALNTDYNDRDVPLLQGEQGPLWYRGYLMSGMDYQRLSQEEVEAVVAKFGVSHMAIAHTTVNAVQALFNKKVFAVDLDVNSEAVPLEGLLCQNGRFFRLRKDASALAL